MMKCGAFSLTLLAGVMAATISFAETGCLPNEQFATVDVSGEIFGNHDFVMESGFRRLTLQRTETGWQIGVQRDDGSAAPVRAHPLGIPSDIGIEINGTDFFDHDDPAFAPASRVRKFIFGRDALDPAQNPELRVPSPPSGEPVNVITVEPSVGEMGMGEVIIEEIGLTDLGSNDRPRLTYLKFSGCLGWNQSDHGENWRSHADPGVPDEVVLTMNRCGLDKRRFRLSDHTTGWGERGSRAFLSLDMTGNGTKEMVAPVRETDTGASGLAMCLRGENRLMMAGFDELSRDVGEFVKHGDYWFANRAPRKPGGFFPVPAGQGFSLGITRGPVIFVYLDRDGTLRTNRQDGR